MWNLSRSGAALLAVEARVGVSLPELEPQGTIDVDTLQDRTGKTVVRRKKGDNF